MKKAPVNWRWGSAGTAIPIVTIHLYYERVIAVNEIVNSQDWGGESWVILHLEF